MTDKPICPYCTEPAELVDSSVIYGKSYGMMYLCKDCDAYVGCHKGGARALGTLANPHLRSLRKKCHHLFDPIWEMLVFDHGLSKPKARAIAYEWLGGMMYIDANDCHIGMFDADSAMEAIELCQDYDPDDIYIKGD